MEPMLMMEPVRPAATACRQKTWEQSHSPRRLMLTRSTHCWSVNSRKGTMVSIPALFTNTSTGPSSFSARVNIASTCERSLTSASTAIARRPLLLTHAATAQAFSHDPTWLMTTSAPSSANTSAMPLPIPWLDPVMIATLLRSFIGHPSALVDRPSTIDHQHVSDYHVRKRAGEKQYRADEVLWLIPSPAWNHFLGSPFLVARPLQDVLSRFGLRDARCDYVHQHAIFRPLERQGTRQMVNTRLGRR